MPALSSVIPTRASPPKSEQLIHSFSVINEQPEFYGYPGEIDHLLAIFKIQARTGSILVLEQHWKRQNNNWKIVLETQISLL